MPVKVTAIFDGETYPLYYGYINRITAYPIKNKQEIYFYATDGIDLLSKTIVVQDMDDKTVMTDGKAVHLVLNAANWKTTVACTMQNAGDTITANGHGLLDGDLVMFTGASIPAALNTTTIYYVVASTDDTFRVESPLGGGAIVFASDGSGFYNTMPRRAVDLDGGDITYFPETFEFTKPA